MNTLAEHLLDPTLPTDAKDLGFPPLQMQHEKRAVTIAAAVFYVADGQPVSLINGLFRPAEFDDLVSAVATFNAGPREGWSQLALASSILVSREVRQLEDQIAQLRLQMEELDDKHISWA